MAKAIFTRDSAHAITNGAATRLDSPNSPFRANGAYFGRWAFSMADLQSERGGRAVRVTKVTFKWQTSAKYTYKIYCQENEVTATSQGACIGSAKGASSSYMEWISCTSEDAALCAFIAGIINSGANAIYATCQNTKTVSGNGYCQRGSMEIEYEYVDTAGSADIVKSVSVSNKCALGSSITYSVTVKNPKTVAMTRVQFEILRTAGDTEVAAADMITKSVSIPSGEQMVITNTSALYAVDDAPRVTPLKLRVTIDNTGTGGDVSDSQTVDFAQALNRLYNPAITRFSAVRAVDGVESDDGIQLMCDLQIALDSETADGFTLKLCYAQDGDVDMSAPTFAPLSLTDESLAQYKAGYENDTGLVTQTFANSSDWSLRLILTDGYETATADDMIFKAFANVHLSGLPTGGVRFGGICTESAENDPWFECDYPAHFKGNVQIDGQIFGGIEYRTGIIDAESIAANKVRVVPVVFAPQFAEGVVPIVMTTLWTSSTAGGHGRVSCGVTAEGEGGVSNTGFTCRIWNGDTSARSPRVMWLAIAPRVNEGEQGDAI